MIAFMFSGQGSQKPFMGKELYENYPQVKEIYHEADGILDFKVTDICFNDDPRLNDTEYTQPTLLTTCIAISTLLDVKADYALGLSLGEYTALVHSGALNFQEAVKLVNKRGKFMTEAVKNLEDTGMYACISMDEKDIKEAINMAGKIGVIEISNYNTNGQIVVAGEMKALEVFLEEVKEKGKTIKLNVSGPFHTSLLEEASVNLSKELDKITFNDFTIPVVTNLNGKIVTKEDLKPTLTRQVKESVKWQQSIEFLLNEGVDTFIEIGPGKTLSSFVKKINRKVNIINIEDIKSLEKAKEILKDMVQESKNE
ncbi:MAG: ACP S-malonyltransferase [Lachnospirales bacterium]